MTRFATKAVHAGLEPDPTYGSVVPAIHQSTTYVQPAPGQFVGDYDYSRSANPTRSALERALGELEGGLASAFSSGMAATHALITAVCNAGDHVVIPDDLYGGTFRLVDKVLKRWGLEYTMVDQADLDAVEAAVTPATKLVWVETPTNPTLKVIDVPGVVARSRGAFVAVDNTFATPVYQRPLELGADAAVHSTTKYLGGHSDVIGGALITDDPDLAERFEFLQKSAGAVPGPFDSYLLLRGIKTLAVRMERHCSNAEAVAQLLADHPKVAEVIYPGLESHPGHLVAAKQMRRFGGMISARLAGGKDAAIELCERTKIFTLAESLGGVESLIEHPGVMTHASAAGSTAAPPDDLVRISVGIEDVDDLIADLDQALR